MFLEGHLNRIVAGVVTNSSTNGFDYNLAFNIQCIIFIGFDLLRDNIVLFMPWKSEYLKNSQIF